MSNDQRRYEIARDVFAAMVASNEGCDAELAVKYADRLLWALRPADEVDQQRAEEWIEALKNRVQP